MEIKKLNIKYFFTEKIWTYNDADLSFMKKRLIHFLQIIYITFSGFKKDKLSVRASALTYFTILSIVPLLALVFGIAQGFGLDKILEREVEKKLATQKEILAYLLDFVHSMLNTAKGGLIAGIGLVMLIWSVMQLMSNIEMSFNKLWAVKNTRSIHRKITDYLTIVILGTVLMILSGSISVFISTQLKASAPTEIIHPIALHLVRILPYLLSWFLFTTLYMVIPNTNVKIRPTLIAGFVVTILYHLFQYGYVHLQAYTTRMNAIYGSFAALPLFLIWMQTTWMLILIGVKLTFAIQNMRVNPDIFDDKDLSLYTEKQLALWIMKIIIERFEEGKRAYSLKELYNKTLIPEYYLKIITQKLKDINLLSSINNDAMRFQPAKSTNQIDVYMVMKMYDTHGINISDSIKSSDFKAIKNQIDLWGNEQEKSNINCLVKDLKLE